MKKFCSLLLSAVLALSFTACGKKDSGKSGKEPKKEKTEKTEDDEGKDKDKKKGEVAPLSDGLAAGQLYFFGSDDERIITGISLTGNICGSDQINNLPTAQDGIRCVFELNEWVEVYLDTMEDSGFTVYVLEHTSDIGSYEEKSYSDEMDGFVAKCALERNEDPEWSWGSFYLNPDDVDPDYYDMVFVHDGKAVALVIARFYSNEEISGMSDEELLSLMKEL